MRSTSDNSEVKESPDYLRMSLSTAMWLDYKTGRFLRNARSWCINLLLTYSEGCYANCAYCGLAHKRKGDYEDKSFIHVEWPIHPTTEIIERIRERASRINRTCISMITNRRSIGDTIEITGELRRGTPVPVSVLASPTIITKLEIQAFKDAGADKIGIAIDAATPELFEKLRGKGVSGPHKWEVYWRRIRESVEIFGGGNVGVHLVTGLGETERQMLSTIQRVHDYGASTHLFSFLAEPGSAMQKDPQPSLGHYRRIQLGRHLIDSATASASQFKFDDDGRLTSFGIPQEKLDEMIDSGEPFRTSGCTGKDGEVACNRPYANTIIPEIRNYPFKPREHDVADIRGQVWQ
jgi:biotin synthase-related radical SAM superfamily protein